VSIVWELRLHDNDGARVATFDIWPELRVEVGVNRPAVFSLRLDGDDARVALFEQDAILEGWWTDAEQGIAWRREFCAWCVDRRRWTDTRGARHFESSGRGLEDLLARTIIDQAAGSVASRKSGAGETVLKAWVDQEAGPGAGARARPGLSIEADTGAGGTWAGQRSNRALLGVCQQVAEATGVQFRIARAGAYTFEFQVSEPDDRRATVVFAEDRGNMGEPAVTEAQSLVANWIKAGGAGAGAGRSVVYDDDAASVALSAQNRRERFVNAADQDAADELEDRAAQELANNRAQTGFTFRALQTPGCLYGKHYFLGDYVRAIYDGVSYDRRVDGVRWAVTPQGVEQTVLTAEAAL
jgi:hypothetical protein